MIRFPLIILGYSDTRLFSIDHTGIHSLPVFTDPSLAFRYQREMSEFLSESGDTRRLGTFVVASPKQFRDLLLAIVMVDKSVRQIIIDHAAPNPILEDSRILDIDDIVDISDAIDYVDGLIDPRLIESVSKQDQDESDDS